MLAAATTTLSVRRRNGEPYEVAPSTVVAEGVRGHIEVPRVVRDQAKEVLTATLHADTTDLIHGDEVTDDVGTTWEVRWVTRWRGLGADHVRAELRRVIR